MKDGFRARMGDLHTWAGLALSALLFAIFWTGTLSVFDKEIDRWMMPAFRIDVNAAAPPLSVDRDVLPLLMARASRAATWTIVLPRERTPFLTLAITTERPRRYVREYFHPGTLEPLPASNRPSASNFIYPFHHNLTLRRSNVGAWLVGIASMGMLCLLISGIVIHRKLFADFFTLRLLRRFGRANLDVHNLTGVVLLPFALVITLSGLVIAHLIYFPQATDTVLRQASEPDSADERTEPAAGERRSPRRAADAATGDDAQRQFMAEGLGRVRQSATGQAAGIASIDRMIAAAEQDWGPNGVYLVRVTHPGDAGGLVVLRRNSHDTVTRQIDNRRFRLATGEALTSFRASTTANVWNFIGGLHYLQFSHWLLRWLYFIGGLGACAMIATGLLHWTQARNKGSRGRRLDAALMNVLNMASITGIIAATGAFLLASRIVEDRERLAAIVGRDFEVQVFFGVWLLSLAHALIRVLRQRQHGTLQAWSEQCWAIAAIAVAAAGLNGITTGDHLVRTVFTETDWPVAAVDLSLLAIAGVAAWAARKLAMREHAAESAKAAQHA